MPSPVKLSHQRVGMTIPRHFIDQVKDEIEQGFITREELGLCFEFFIDCFYSEGGTLDNKTLRSKYGNAWVRYCLQASQEMNEAKNKYISRYAPVQRSEGEFTPVQRSEGELTPVEAPAGDNRIEKNKNRKEENKNRKESNLKEKKDNSAFDDFWASYPKREAKQQAVTTYKKHIKAGVSHESIMQALKRYVAKWATNATADQYIPKPSSWLNTTPWLDEGVTPPEQLIRGTVATDTQAYVERVRAHMKAGGWVRVSGNGAPLNDPISSGFKTFIRYEDVTGYDPVSNTLFWQWYNPMKRWEPNEVPVKEARDSTIEPHYVDVWEGEPPCET